MTESDTFNALSRLPMSTVAAEWYRMIITNDTNEETLKTFVKRHKYTMREFLTGWQKSPYCNNKRHTSSDMNAEEWVEAQLVVIGEVDD